MPRFEYDTLFCEVRKRQDYDALRRILNERRAQGREVISVDPGDYGYTVFLKCEIAEHSAEASS